MKLSTRVRGVVLTQLGIFFGISGLILYVFIVLIPTITGTQGLLSEIPQETFFILKDAGLILGVIGLIFLLIGVIIVVRALRLSQSVSEIAIRQGWKKMKETFWQWVIILLVGGIIVQGVGYLVDTNFSNEALNLLSVREIVGVISGNLLSFFLTGLMLVVTAGLSIDLIRERSFPGYKNLFSRIDTLIPWLITYILYYVIKIVGFILFIIPGIYRSIRFKFWDLFVIERGYSPIQALKASWRITQGNRWETYVIHGYQGLIQIPGFLVLIVGLFATVPTSMISDASAYSQFLKQYEDKVLGNSLGEEKEEELIEISDDITEEIVTEMNEEDLEE